MKNHINVVKINFNINPEEYNKFIRAIKNIENLFNVQFFDDEEFYDSLYPNDNDSDYYFGDHS